MHHRKEELMSRADDRQRNPRAAPRHVDDGGRVANSRTISTILLLSGSAGLIYQVLWMKQLGLLFGNTAHATAATLASFFAGLAVGSWFWGKRAGVSSNPLRLYALLEVGIALTALVYFVILNLFYAVYPAVYQSASGAVPMVIIKFALSLLLIFPPACCMGGTLPAIAQHLIRNPGAFGKTAARLYGINTLGAALGVICSVFLLIPHLGFRLTYAVAMLLSVSVAGIAWRLSVPCAATDTPRNPPDRTRTLGEQEAALRKHGGLDLGGCVAAVVCFFSGFAVLALEVLWTRMYAQVHENTVYSFAVILTVVLTCLALGAWISARLSRLKAAGLMTLGVLTTIGGVVLTLGPSLFMHVTHNLRALSSLESWGRYVLRIFCMGFGGIGIVVLALGTVFPFLMRMTEQQSVMPGRALGRLLALNTAGAIAGSLLCGFVFLPTMGLWQTMQLITAGYLIIGLLIPFPWNTAGIACRSLAVIFLLLLFTELSPARLPTYGAHPGRAPEVVLETWQGSDCTVTVVQNQLGSRAIKINSGYVLGSSSAYTDQVNQTRIPLYLYPETKSIFFLGLGTGTTAGAALDRLRFEHVKRIVSCELTPAVVAAAKKYMPPELTGGVFTDPRSTLLIEDGRHYLRVCNDAFDMINADLFLPYRRGAGSLYSLDHYRTAARRLTPGGVFVQWVPLFQITDDEFGIIVRTMLEAFGQVTMWRNNFTPGHEQIALIGQHHTIPLAPGPPVPRETMLKALEALHWQDAEPSLALPHPATITYFYCGNLTAAASLFEAYPVNTDDRPLIEYLTPRLFRKVAAKEQIIWFVGPRIAEMTDRILACCPPAADPVLAQRAAGDRRLVTAGTAFHKAMIYKVLGRTEASREQWETFRQEWRAAAAMK